MYDFIIIGGGIVGVSTAWHLQQRHPKKKILIVEKEPAFAIHQTGHNSGVIHAGVYYQPGSLKARFCREGSGATVDFCSRYGIPWERCGKLLVATNSKEQVWMEALLTRIKENDIEVRPLGSHELKALEPRISGLSALFIPATGIVDYTRVTRKMAALFRSEGGGVFLDTPVTGLDEKADRVSVHTPRGKLDTAHVIVCSGLMADRLVKMAGLRPGFQIVPFRGEYYRLPSSKMRIIKHLIYPIPDPDLPFLGVHLTRMIDGSVTVGPNAVLGLKREGYKKTDISFRDLAEMAVFRGFWRVIRANLRSGLSEFRDSLIKRGYLSRVRNYCPEIRLSDLEPYPAGVRAQAVAKDGSMIHDFLFVNTPRIFHVCNAPSPAATSAIPIGRHIVEKVETLVA